MVYLGIAVLGIILGASLSDNYLTGRSYTGRFGYLAVSIAGLAVFLFLVSVTRLQFITWQAAGPPSGYLIPPYRGIGYFLFYAGTRFWAPYLVSGLAGWLVFWIAGYLNKKYEERFFRPEEPYFIGLSLFLNGHPGWIVYLFLALAAALIFALGHRLVAGEIRPLSFYYLWLPAGLLSIILNALWTRQLDWWQGLVI